MGEQNFEKDMTIFFDVKSKINTIYLITDRIKFRLKEEAVKMVIYFKV